MNTRIFVIFAVVFAIGCMGCEREYDLVTKHMFILPESVKVHITEDRPALVTVQYDMQFGGCDMPLATEWHWEGNICYVEVYKSAPHPDASADCPDGIFELTRYTVIGRVDSGTYQVHIDGNIVDFEVLPRKESDV